MLQVLIGTPAVDYSDYYVGGSFEALERTGSDWTAFKLKLECPLVAPAAEAEIVIWDSPSQTRKLAAGRIKRPGRVPKGPDPADGVTTRFGYALSCEGWVRDIDRAGPIARTWQNKTTGFIARDIITSFCPTLDASGVTTGGRLLPEFAAQHEEIKKVLDRLATIEQRRWWVDNDKLFYFDLPGDTPAPFELTDDTWKEIAGLDLRVEFDTAEMANEITMFYDGRYGEGLVNVFNASNSVTGVGTLFFPKVTPDAKFRLVDTEDVTAVYTVVKVNNDTELVLGSNYNEDTAAGVAYVIEGIQRKATAADTVSQAFYAAITGDDGVFRAVIPAPPGSLTYREALDYINGVLDQRANPEANINFPSNSRRITGEPHAGQSVVVFLTEFGGIDTVLQIRELKITDTGAADENGDHVWAYEFKFQARLYDLAHRLKKLEELIGDVSNNGYAYLDESRTSFETVVPVEDVFGIAASGEAIEVITPVEVVSQEELAYWPPFVWGPSVKLWDTAADWDEWALDGLLSPILLDGLTLPDGSLTGSATSPWLIQYSANALKSYTLTATIPDGCSVLVEWRSSDTQDEGAVWQADIATLPDAKYMQARVTATRTSTADPLAIGALSFSEYKTVMRWNRTWWMGAKDEYATAAAWSTWTLTGLVIVEPVDAPMTTDGGLTLTTDGGDPIELFATGGSLALAPGETEGTAESPWEVNRVRTVVKEVVFTTLEPAGASAALVSASSIDATDTNASAYGDLRDTPDAGYVKHHISVSQLPFGEAVEVQSLVISPK